MADDSPFVTDSVLIALGADGAQTRFFANDVVRREAHPPTAIFYAELDALDTGDLAALEVRLRETLLDVKAVVADFAAMRERLTLARDALADWGFGGRTWKRPGRFSSGSPEITLFSSVSASSITVRGHSARSMVRWGY